MSWEPLGGESNFVFSKYICKLCNYTESVVSEIEKGGEYVKVKQEMMNEWFN